MARPLIESQNFLHCFATVGFGEQQGNPAHKYLSHLGFLEQLEEEN